MLSKIVPATAAAFASAGRELHARVLLSALAIKAHPTGFWPAAPGIGARTIERSARAIDAIEAETHG